MQQMFGLSYHCGNCDGLASHLNRGKCPTCGSTSVVSAGWYQLSVEERTEWIERINGRRSPVDRYRLDQPGIRERIVLPPLQSCTALAARHAVMAPPRELDRPSPLLVLWASFCAWLSSLFGEETPAPAQQVVQPLVHQLEPVTIARMTRPVRPRIRATRPVVWSRDRAPRTRVRVQGPRTTTRAAAITRAGPGPPRRRRLRTA
jgi:hypothetical protein